MKAVVLKGYGAVENLEVTDVPEPKVGPREVKVRVGAASINPVDYKARRGDLRAWMPLDLPAILGRDAAGEVVEVGSEVDAFAVGDRVMGLVWQAYAEFVVAPAESFAKMLPEMEMDEAGALPLVGLTGAQLIEDTMDVQEGNVVLVTGAVGSVGRVAVFAAKQRGAKVIAGVRSSQKQMAEALDAESIIALDDPNELSHLPPLDAIADTVNGQVIESVLGKLKPKGTLGTVLGEPRSAKERGILVRTMLGHPDSRRLAELGESVARGHLELRIQERFPLSEVRLAHELAEQSNVGKILLLV